MIAAISQTPIYEQRLISLIRRLPPHCVSQVIAFAEFLEFRIIENKDARWDELLATDESQRLLEKMADEALTEINAGRARPVVFTDDGQIGPG